MFKEALARAKYLFKPSSFIKQGYDEAYTKGLAEGRDFGMRIAHNQTMATELADILTRYTQLQLKVINKPASFIREELNKFQQTELERLKMDLQNRE